MNTKSLLVAAAAAFLLSSGPLVAAGAQNTETKVCYRTVHKLPYRVRIPCPKPKQQAPLPPAQPEPAQPPAPPKTP